MPISQKPRFPANLDWIGTVQQKRTVLLIAVFVLVGATELAAQSAVRYPAFSASGLDRLPISKPGGPITSKFVDPFMTNQQIERIYGFLNQPNRFSWGGETTIRDIQRDLASHLAVEIDVRALDEIGISIDEEICPELSKSKASVSDSAHTDKDDPFADPFDAEPDDKQDPVVTKSESQQQSPRQNPTKWWRSQQNEAAGEQAVSNGARLFNFLDRFDLTLNVHLGQLKITTFERAEQHCCVRIFDVTPLVDVSDSADANELNSLAPPFGGSYRDEQSLIDVIMTSIDPDTWEAVGGPSTLVTIAVRDRCWLVVSAPLVQQWKIAALLDRLNE